MTTENQAPEGGQLPPLPAKRRADAVPYPLALARAEAIKASVQQPELEAA